MIKIKTKPLSVNGAWKGRRYKSDEYKNYEVGVTWMLPKITIPEPPFKVSYEFGFSSKGSDIDNPVKCFQDILVKKYGFKDQDIYELHVTKKIVKKGKEYIKFKIETLNN
jgi:Holliday junction resolvase RusA-like endonuclease